MYIVNNQGFCVETNIPILQFNKILLQVQINDHARLYMDAIMLPEYSYEDVLHKYKDGFVFIKKKDDIIFKGMLNDIIICNNTGVKTIKVKSVSYSYQLDMDLNSRSFQTVTDTYADVAKEIIANNKDSSIICNIGKKQIIVHPLIQYNETDWMFLKRIASHLGGVLVPEIQTGKCNFWFGLKKGKERCKLIEGHYKCGIDSLFYELGGTEKGYKKEDFIYYIVDSDSNFELGDWSEYRKSTYSIIEKQIIFQNGTILYRYKMIKSLSLIVPICYNAKIVGMSLGGVVKSTENETVKLQLDIDGEVPRAEYSYNWTPPTGNIMYCMPQKETRATLYSGSCDERCVQAINSPRTNGGTEETANHNFNDYNNRTLTSEDGKEINLQPNLISMVGTDEIGDLSVVLCDSEGITITTPRGLQLIAQEQIKFKAPKITINHAKDLNVFRDAQVASIYSQNILAKGSFPQPVVLTEGGSGKTSTLTIYNQYNFKAGYNTVLQGRSYQLYSPINDAPKKAEFDWWGLAGNILAGVAMVGCVVGLIVATVGTGGLAGAAICGAIMVGGMAILGKAAGDIASGNVSDSDEYILTGFFGACAGAITGLMGAGSDLLMAKLAWKGLGAAVFMGFEGVAENIIEDKMLGTETTLAGWAATFLLSAFTAGILDNVYRNGRRAGKETLDEVAEDFGKYISDLEREARQLDAERRVEDLWGKLRNPRVSKYIEQLDNMSPNKINHVINGSKNSTHNWEKLVPDKNWDDIKNIIADVMETGVEGPYKTVFSKKAIVNGFEVEVTYTKLIDGTIKISDAWVIN